ncbi:MAG: DUF4386 domain-containing protein [Caldilineaceae bacterium]
MQNQPIEQTPRKTARMAGLLYLILIIAGIFAQGYVREGLIMAPGDAAATAHNIVAAEGLFRLSIAGDLVMILCDIALGVLFYLLLRPVSNALALMAAFFRLAQAATLGLNLLNLFVALNLAKGMDTLAQFATAQQQALAMLFVNAHSTGYDIALIFFSIYLLLLGYLMTKSSYFPGFLGTMLVVAGVCYLIDSFSFLYPAYAALTGQMMVAPTVLAELTWRCGC